MFSTSSKIEFYCQVNFCQNASFCHNMDFLETLFFIIFTDLCSTNTGKNLQASMKSDVKCTLSIHVAVTVFCQIFLT